MPFVQIYRPSTFTAARKKINSRAIHGSLVAIFNVPQDDYFHVIKGLDTGDLLYPDNYLQIQHPENMV